jgi:hypothetical protein
MSTGVHGPTRARIEAKTLRTDRWWVYPVTTFVVFSAFIIYATVRAFMGSHYYSEPYLSPFYSPCLGAACPDEFRIASLPTFGLSPAILVMIVVFGFRTTCYYYRKTYYRSMFFDPPACAVGEPWGKGYRGETFFPLILQNFHRYFLYLALVVIAFLWYDTAKAFDFGGRPGIGVGSILLAINAVLITGYVFGCHSFRHLVGGSVDCTNCSRFGQARQSAWKRSSWFNAFHGNWAWASLVFVCVADIYVRLCSMGVITDPHLVF